MSEELVYQDRIVIFVDVLGFKDKLKVFEKEAEKSYNEKKDKYSSKKVNEFISVFKDGVSNLDKDYLKQYLFSDNICITVNYEDPNQITSVLFMLCDLFHTFASKGYFLRGGIDVGKFIDEDKIAVGFPLVNAYEIECKTAVYPRIVLSNNCYNLFIDLVKNGNLPDPELFEFGNLISKSCEIKYLNVFYNVMNKDDKVSYLSVLRDSILDNLIDTNENEHIHVKYEWLLNEFNTFIDYLTSTLIFTDKEYEHSEEEIALIKQLKS